jgi:lactoylglutathione lyase
MRILVLLSLSAVIVAGGAHAADAPQTKAKTSQPTASAEQPRLSYVAFRVLDLDRSLKFYVGLLGMKERQRIPLDSGVLEVLLGYGDPSKDAGILLLHNPSRKEPYTHGDGYHRFILGIEDMKGTIARLKQNGVKVTREPTRVENLKLSYAFIADPDGYAIELVEID